MHYYGVERSTDSLRHYGVKGMRWGVRKALVTGNQRALDRHFRKAAKKLRKLEDIATNSKKYAAKASAYGVAAAGTGTLVVAPKLNPLLAPITSAIKKRGVDFSKLNEALAKKPLPKKYLSYSVGEKIDPRTGNPIPKVVSQKNPAYDYEYQKVLKERRKLIKEARKEPERKINTANALLRVGAGVATAGLGAAAGVNAYRATHGKKYRQKAMNFRNEMDRVFAGTKYAGKYTVQKKAKKWRK